MAREIWALYLNDMRSPKSEVLGPVGWGDTEAALKAFVAREKVATYTDGQWGKTFRSGGPLEWFNGPGSMSRDTSSNSTSNTSMSCPS